MQDSSIAGIWREEGPRSAMGSGVRAQNLRQAVSRDQGKFDKERLASWLRFGAKRIDLLQAVGV